MSKRHIAPLLKWVGGKTQILEEVLRRFPPEIHNYLEPFVGGGAVLFGLLGAIERGEVSVTGRILVSDVNPVLILFYEVVRDHLEDFLVEVEGLQAVLDSVAVMKQEGKGRRVAGAVLGSLEEACAVDQEEVYYWFRQEWNDLKGLVVGPGGSRVRLAALTLFLNRCGFRGLYREGRTGKYNVPFGHYRKVRLLDTAHAVRVRDLLVKHAVEFHCLDFREALLEEGVLEDFGDFAYLDSPYYPEKSDSFVDYTGSGFSGEDHEALLGACRDLDEKGVQWLQSNAATPWVRESYAAWKMDVLECRRAIHSKKPGSVTLEVCIANV